MGTDGSYACGEQDTTYRILDSLYCTPATNVTFRVNYTQKKKKKEEEENHMEGCLGGSVG